MHDSQQGTQSNITFLIYNTIRPKQTNAPSPRSIVLRYQSLVVCCCVLVGVACTRLCCARTIVLSRARTQIGQIGWASHPSFLTDITEGRGALTSPHRCSIRCFAFDVDKVVGCCILQVLATMHFHTLTTAVVCENGIKHSPIFRELNLGSLAEIRSLVFTYISGTKTTRRTATNGKVRSSLRSDFVDLYIKHYWPA
jgi:hypothetical protein